jgi:prepilin-type N-terminal cleavage/methylation domain-containing protein/prepilin-type processing-associated H-X9-DG protein
MTGLLALIVSTSFPNSVRERGEGNEEKGTRRRERGGVELSDHSNKVLLDLLPFARYDSAMPIPKPRTAFTLIELLVVIAIIGILLAMLLPAVQKTRSTAIRLRCQSNLRNVGAALHGYQADMNVFPPGVSPAAAGEPHWYWSWMAYLMPYLDQTNLSIAANNFARTPTATNSMPWDPWGMYTGLGNPALGTHLQVWHCAADTRTLVARDVSHFVIAFTSFLGVCGTRGDSAMHPNQNGMLYHSSKVKTADVPDGLSNTAMVGERPPSADFFYGWWFAGAGYPDFLGRQLGVGDVVLGSREEGYANYLGCPPASTVGLRPGTLENPCDQAHYWSLHSGGTNFLMADGSVRFVTYHADAILVQLFSRNGSDAFEFP